MSLCHRRISTTPTRVAVVSVYDARPRAEVNQLDIDKCFGFALDLGSRCLEKLQANP